MNKINNIEDWTKFCKDLIIDLEKEGINVIDFHLVGSKLRNFSKNSDIDNVIIIKDKFDINQLEIIRRLINLIIDDKISEDEFHFKLFDEKSIQDFAMYDGFRLASFQKSNFSINKSKSLYKANPVLDMQNFLNAVLIQTVYRFFQYLPFSSITIFEHEVKEWAKFNLLFNPICTINNNNIFSQIQGMSSEIDDFINLLSKDSITKKGLINYLSQYFQIIPHEYVNKKEDYFSKVNKFISNGN